MNYMIVCLLVEIKIVKTVYAVFPSPYVMFSLLVIGKFYRTFCQRLGSFTCSLCPYFFYTPNNYSQCYS